MSDCSTISVATANGQGHIVGFSPSMDFCYAPGEKMIYGYWMRERSMRPRLQHEILHAMRDRRLPMPIYLEEGIAELMEGYQYSDKGPRLQNQTVAVDWPTSGAG